MTKSEQNKCGPDIPSEMDGGLKINDTLKKYYKEIWAEIELRELQYPNYDDEKQQYMNSWACVQREIVC